MTPRFFPRTVGALALSAFAALALSALACTESSILEGIGSFPCAKDLTCPVSYSCQKNDAGTSGTCTLDTSGLLGKKVDEVCEADDLCGDTDCAYGVCPAVASASGVCPADHPVNVVGGCLLACSASSPCPSPLVCFAVQVGIGDESIAQACVSPAQAAVVDSPCGTNLCPRYGAISPFACIDGACVFSCSTSGNLPCPNGRVCVAPTDASGPTEPGCFVDCSANGTGCPSSQFCSSAGGGTGAYCSP